MGLTVDERDLSLSFDQPQVEKKIQTGNTFPATEYNKILYYINTVDHKSNC